MQHFTSKDINWWTGVVWIIVIFFQLFELSFWRHPFTAEDPLVSKWCNAIFLQICSNDKQTPLHLGWIEDDCNFNFCLNYSLNVFCVQGQEVFLDMCPPLEATRERISSARSVSSQSSRKSSHTALSDSACEYKRIPRLTLCTCASGDHVNACVLSVSIANSSVRYTEACTSSRQSAPINPEKSSSRMPHSGSKVQTCSSSSLSFIGAVFSLTWSFRNHSNMLILVLKKHILLACWKKLCCLIFWWKLWWFFLEWNYLMNRKFKRTAFMWHRNL